MINRLFSLILTFTVAISLFQVSYIQSNSFINTLLSPFSQIQKSKPLYPDAPKNRHEYHQLLLSHPSVSVSTQLALRKVLHQQTWFLSEEYEKIHNRIRLTVLRGSHDRINQISTTIGGYIQLLSRHQQAYLNTKQKKLLDLFDKEMEEIRNLMPIFQETYDNNSSLKRRSINHERFITWKLLTLHFSNEFLRWTQQNANLSQKHLNKLREAVKELNAFQNYYGNRWIHRRNFGISHKKFLDESIHWLSLHNDFMSYNPLHFTWEAPSPDLTLDFETSRNLFFLLALFARDNAVKKDLENSIISFTVQNNCIQNSVVIKLSFPKNEEMIQTIKEQQSFKDIKLIAENLNAKFKLQQEDENFILTLQLLNGSPNPPSSLITSSEKMETSL